LQKIAWGDVPTWFAVIAASAAALVALRQLLSQQMVIAQQARQLDRQQADRVDFTWCGASQVLNLSVSAIPKDVQAVLVVANNSRRPIRDVTCWIEPGPSHPGRLPP
jgi:hypothetical protein